MAHDVSADDLTLPAINSLVQVSVSGGDSYRSRVEDAGDGLVTVAAPLDLPVTDIPELGTPLAVRWGAGARGRYVLTGPLVEILTGTPPRWVMRPDGPPRIEQTREFVRGGGDEAHLGAPSQPAGRDLRRPGRRCQRGRRTRALR